MQLITVKDAARELGLSESSIKTVAIDHGVGTLVHPRLRTFSQADLRLLRRIFADRFERRSPGRPKKTC